VRTRVFVRLQMFRASQTARKCFHLFRSLEELEKIQALMHDQVRDKKIRLEKKADGELTFVFFWGSCVCVSVCVRVYE
jgi:hypothetical protein